MKIKNYHANVVLVAHKFNPSIITQLWLVKNGILAEEDFEDGCLFSSIISQVQSHNFSLLILPDQLQFAPKLGIGNEQELVLAKVGKIIEKLPHTPYTAAGLNFIWLIDSEDEGMRQFTKSIFYRDIPLYREFDTEDSRFGGYLSKNVLGCRLKLDIKPITITKQQEQKENLQFSFNFHLDLLEENKVENILGLLKNWNEANGLSSNIINNVAKG